MNVGELLAVAYRGDYEDLGFTGHILVVDSAGEIVYSLGDPDKMVFARSSAKLFQAMVVLESGLTVRAEYKIDKEGDEETMEQGFDRLPAIGSSPPYPARGWPSC